MTKYSLSELEKLSNIFGGVGTGATSGAAIGNVVPGLGTVPGMLIGGVAGLGAGIAQNRSDQQALEAAMIRDEELEARIADVDNFAPFLEAINARTVGREQEAGIRSRQAAARGGLSQAAQEGIASQAIQQAGIERGTALAQAVPLAAQADIAEKNRILQEEFGRQQLLDEAMASQDVLSSFGQAAGSAAMLSQLLSSPDVSGGGSMPAGEKAKRIADALGETTLRESMFGTGSLYDTPPGTSEFSGSIPIEDPFGALEGAPDRSAMTPEASVDLVEAQNRQKSMQAWMGDPRTAESNAAERRGAAERSDEARESIRLDIETGRATTEELDFIIKNSPEALMDSDDWRAALAAYRASQPGATAGAAEFDLTLRSPEQLKAFTSALFSSS